MTPIIARMFINSTALLIYLYVLLTDRHVTVLCRLGHPLGPYNTTVSIASGPPWWSLVLALSIYVDMVRFVMHIYQEVPSRCHHGQYAAPTRQETAFHRHQAVQVFLFRLKLLELQALGRKQKCVPDRLHRSALVNPKPANSASVFSDPSTSVSGSTTGSCDGSLDVGRKAKAERKAGNMHDH
jgi:hypothetical protein